MSSELIQNRQNRTLNTEIERLRQTNRTTATVNSDTRQINPSYRVLYAKEPTQDLPGFLQKLELL